MPKGCAREVNHAHQDCLNPVNPIVLQESPQWDEWIAEAFAAFCDDGSGRLSRDALNSMLCGEVCVVRNRRPSYRVYAGPGSRVW